MHPSLPVVIALAIASVAMAPPVAQAEEAAPFSFGSKPSWFLLGGITGGATVGFVKTRGGFVGGELSFVRLHQSFFAGFYADAAYDFGAGGTYATGGIEIGKGLVGLDGGVALRLAGGRTEVGGAGRVFLSVLGLLTLYVRYDYFPVTTDAHVLQTGLLLKLPLAAPFGGD